MGLYTLFVLKMTWQDSIQSCYHLFVTISCLLEQMVVIGQPTYHIHDNKSLRGDLNYTTKTQTKGTKHVAIHEMGQKSAWDGGFNIHPVIQAGGILSS